MENRIIKFKQPIKGTIIEKVDAYKTTLKTHKSKNITWHYWGFIDDRFICPVNKYNSLQYTGLNDKNGKEIYEGDILNVRFKIDEVENYLYLNLTEKEKKEQKKLFIVEDIFYLYTNPVPADIEIIGNIFENASLLDSK